MRLRRDILLFSLLAGVALAGGWWLLTHRPGGAVEAYRQKAEAVGGRVAAASPPAETFRATLCEAGACALVEAGGLAFLFGAGEGAADSLRKLGLVRADVDLVLVADLDLATVAGLPAVARELRQAGRGEPLRVNGPDGLLPVIDGANLIASADSAVRLAVSLDGRDEGLDGRVVFDSGVVLIRAFRSGDGRGRAFRVEYDGKSLVLAGCRAGGETTLAAIRGVQTAAGILQSGAALLSPGQQRCPDVADVLNVAIQGRLAATLVSPDTAKEAFEAWRELLAGRPEARAQLGTGGVRLDLTGIAPTIRD